MNLNDKLPHRVKDITGQKFHRLKVIRFSHMFKRTSGFSNAKWVCVCDCGNEVTVSANCLKTGHTKSCGCIRKGRVSPHRGEYGESSKNLALTRYKKSAETRNIPFNLTREEFLRIAELACYYCNAIPRKVITPDTYYGEAYLNGVDRVNNSAGYSVDNCVPCCSDCNYMKQESTIEQFRAKIIEIYHHWASKPEDLPPPPQGGAD